MTGESPLVGVGVVLVEEGRLLLVKRRHEPGKGLWAVPGGKVNLGESLVDAAAREVKEETCLDVKIGDVIWVGESVGAHGHIVLIDFLGSVIGGHLAPSDDADAAAWVSLSDIDGYPLTPTMPELIAVLDGRGK